MSGSATGAESPRPPGRWLRALGRHPRPHSPHPGLASDDVAPIERDTLAVLAVYNLVQNLAVPEGLYVPVNLVVTAGLVATARRAGLDVAAMGLAPDRLGRGLVWGGAAAAIAGVTAAAAVRQPILRRFLRDERARTAHPLYRAAVRFPLGTALFEEVAFRGVLDGAWRRRSPRAARVLTAVAFWAWHLLPTFRAYPQMGFRGGTGLRNRLQAAMAGAAITTVAGFGFTWLRERSGSVAAPWLAHAAYNTAAFLAARAAWRADTPAEGR